MRDNADANKLIMEERKPSPPQHVKETIQKVLEEAREKSGAENDLLMEAWNTIIQREIKQHATITRFQNGTLFLNIDTSVWMYEIENKYKKKILASLQNKLGKNVIKKIVLNIGQ